MQNPKGDGARPGSTNRSETCRAVVADLSTVIEQVRKSLKLIESEIASEASSEEALFDDVVVLDDVTPGYARAYAVLRECEAGLGVALHLLQEAVAAGDGRCEFASDGSSPPTRLPVSA